MQDPICYNTQHHSLRSHPKTLLHPCKYGDQNLYLNGLENSDSGGTRISSVSESTALVNPESDVDHTCDTDQSSLNQPLQLVVKAYTDIGILVASG